MSLHKIEITKIENSRLPQVDFDNLAFGREFSDHMFIADYDGTQWTNFRIKPLEKLSIHPGNLAWHYGQSIFEGMKASITTEGVPMLFRPELHVERLNASAERMCMPAFPKEVFLDAVHNLVSMEKAWIPSEKGSALYLRPLMIATDEALGVRPSDLYSFFIMCLPVGPYYSKPVSLLAETKYIRAAEGGVGEAKTAGNYAASLYPAMQAKKQGYDQIMWLDGVEFKYVQEVGTMNIFFVIDGKVVTPSTTGSILKGITRKSAMVILKHEGYEVEERMITIEEIFEAHENGTLQEVFGTGTAAVVAKVSKIGYKGKDIEMTGDTTVGDKIKSTIEGLRDGTQEDHWGWTIAAKQMETA